MRIWITALSGLLALPAFGQDLPGDAAAGKEMARSICAECHYVEREWADLYVFEAPSFVEIANGTNHSVMSLQVFFRSPHNRMPNIKLSADEIDNLISYILTLQE